MRLARTKKRIDSLQHLAINWNRKQIQESILNVVGHPSKHDFFNFHKFRGQGCH